MSETGSAGDEACQVGRGQIIEGQPMKLELSLGGLGLMITQ